MTTKLKMALVLLPGSVLLSGCEVLRAVGESLGPVASDPAVQEKLQEAAVAAATGNYVVAGYSLGAAAVAGATIWLKKRMTASEPGKIL